MSILDLFKKKESAPAASPITKFDQQLPPLSQPLEPFSSPKPPQLPPLPPMAAPIAAPKPVPFPVSVPPRVAPQPVTPPRPLGDLPKISVAPTMPAHAVPAPMPITPPPPKLENSRLAKALDELTSSDFTLDVEEKPAPKPAPVAQPIPVQPRTQTSPKLKFIGMPVFDACIRELKQVQVDLTETQANNERLGMLENQKKNSYETIISNFENVQKQLLTIDEKLFKVN